MIENFQIDKTSNQTDNALIHFQEHSDFQPWINIQIFSLKNIQNEEKNQISSNLSLN